jgi:hypothetical protein
VGEEQREVAQLLGRLPSGAARGGRRGGGERRLLLEEEAHGEHHDARDATDEKKEPAIHMPAW